MVYIEEMAYILLWDNSPFREPDGYQATLPSTHSTQRTENGQHEWQGPCWLRYIISPAVRSWFSKTSPFDFPFGESTLW